MLWWQSWNDFCCEQVASEVAGEEAGSVLDWRKHSCIDYLLLMFHRWCMYCFSQTLFTIIRRGILLHANVWTVQQAAGGIMRGAGKRTNGIIKQVSPLIDSEVDACQFAFLTGSIFFSLSSTSWASFPPLSSHSQNIFPYFSRYPPPPGPVSLPWAAIRKNSLAWTWELSVCQPSKHNSKDYQMFLSTDQLQVYYKRLYGSHQWRKLKLKLLKPVIFLLSILTSK